MNNNTKSIIESLLYIKGRDGTTVNEIKKVINLPVDDIRKLLKEMKKEYDQNVDRGITIQQYGDTYRLLTKKENHDILTLIYDTKTKSPLTQSLLETLAIVAYNQPCPSSLIEKIRGHNALNGLEKLTKLDLIKCIGRANTPGKPYLYEITNKFYDLFGIKSMKELPNIDKNINLDELDNSFDFFDSSKEDGKTKKN
ncbi:MAG: SMC-Scp complex subunit ScpB [Mycoplasma sp.]|nr:SMC-Scp complex subunit ScpB [Mycoplasma sp.]